MSRLVSLPSGATGERSTQGERALSLYRLLCGLQGLYYLLTGVWPLVSVDTFQMVTGPKTDNLATGLEIDHWLVKTAGVVIASIGLALLVASRERSASVAIATLAFCTAAGLTAIDIIYVSRGVIAPIYLLDAALEVPLLLGWAWWFLRGGPGSR